MPQNNTILIRHPDLGDVLVKRIREGEQRRIDRLAESRVDQHLAELPPDNLPSNARELARESLSDMELLRRAVLDVGILKRFGIDGAPDATVTLEDAQLSADLARRIRAIGEEV